MRAVLAILAVVLFFGNYFICEIFYKNDLTKWWGLKQNIYNVIIAICFYLARFKAEGEIRLILNVGLGLCLSNCIDRLIFDINTFQFNDIFMIIITIIAAYADVKQWLKR